ncbi:hypothetical protein [Sinorhizobium meliloti]|uniref:hypothetical protein n=1 Tax=Rhizobium meliloti TaxID=382 RepID=UPI00309F1E57
MTLPQMYAAPGLVAAWDIVATAMGIVAVRFIPCDVARDERFQNGNGGDPNSHVELAHHGELVGAVASLEPDPVGATEADQAKLTLTEVGAIFAEAYALVLSRRRGRL